MSIVKILTTAAVLLFATHAWAADEDDNSDNGVGTDKIVIDAEHGARIRFGATVHSRIVGVVRNNTEVEVTGKMHGNWVPVKVGEREGFIYKDLLKDTKTGKTLDRATEAGVICTTGDCASRHRTVAKNNQDDIEKVNSHLTPKKKKKKAPPVAEPASDDDDDAPKPLGKKGFLPHAAQIQKALWAGLTAPRNWCGLAVWRILLKAGLVKGSWGASGADAINMGPILKRQGFIKNNSVCNRPGVVRIYNGNHCGHGFRNPMVGDRVGHIEIFGTDNQYHSFFHSSESITQHLGKTSGCMERRPLQSCWYKP